MRRFLRPKYDSLSDEELIDLYLTKGDEVALNKLVERYYQKVYYFALSIMKNPANAEDAAMEVWGKLQKYLSKYTITNFSSWLMTVVRSHCLQMLKKRLKHRTEELDEKNNEAFMEFPSFDTPTEEPSDLERLSKAVDGLKKEQNQCIVAFYFQGMSYQEIVREEGFTLKEVKTHIQNGKRNLRLQLTK